jgi:hypothetical protein
MEGTSIGFNADVDYFARLAQADQAFVMYKVQQTVALESRKHKSVW